MLPQKRGPESSAAHMLQEESKGPPPVKEGNPELDEHVR